MDWSVHQLQSKSGAFAGAMPSLSSPSRASLLTLTRICHILLCFPTPTAGECSGMAAIARPAGQCCVSAKLPALTYIFMGRGRMNRPIVLPVCNSCSCSFSFSPLIPILAPTQPRRLASRCCGQSLHWPTALQWACGRRSLLW